MNITPKKEIPFKNRQGILYHALFPHTRGCNGWITRWNPNHTVWFVGYGDWSLNISDGRYHGWCFYLE